ncbi:MAG: hypothetical protein AAFQ43_04750 [Bacteroidota bacterium]
MRTPTLLAALAIAAFLPLSGCDAVDTDPNGPPPLTPLPSDQQALVVQAFQDVEALFDLGTGAVPNASSRDGRGQDPAAAPSWRDWLAQFGRTQETGTPADPSARLAPDTTLYTGVYDAGNARGYLAVLTYREPQGVGVWSARLQHARPVDHDDDAATPNVGAVETVDLTFIAYADLASFLAGVESGANAYLVGTSDDAETAFTSPTIDVWRVAQVYSPADGGAIVTYANAELRETVTLRNPIVTLGADGTGTVRDGGTSGAVRTRYYGADFTVASDGSVSGTLLRTLTSSGDIADGALVSRTDYAADATYVQTRQRGGDGVVIRENSEG